MCLRKICKGKRKAPTRKNPHERLTIKGLRIGSETKISRFGLQDKSFDKTSANKTKSPTLPTKCPAWNAGLWQSRGFLLKNFCNAFQPVAYRRPAVMRLCCNVWQREPLHVPQPSDFPVNPPKRCAFDSGGHLLSVKSLQRSGQYYTSRRHRQHRARKAAAVLRRCA